MDKSKEAGKVRVAKPHEMAGVRCPKETGEMKKEESCTECPHFVKCYAVVLGRL